ncbi:MAG: hypothetical protein AB9891_11305 [Anaerolineaceae bacterium]
MVGFQGLILLVWIDSRPGGFGIFCGLKWIFFSLAALACIAFFVWLFQNPGQAGLYVGVDLNVVGSLFLLLFCLIFAQKGRLWFWIALVTSIILFFVPLIGIWASGASDLNFLTGLFPFNDAHGYYLGARRLVDGTTFNSFAAHRPLFPAFLGFLLGITSQNLQISVLFLVVLGGISSFLFSAEIRRTQGIVAGSLAFLLSFVFFRRFIGSTMTEVQGFAMGAAGFAVLWCSISERNLMKFSIGLACLSIALNARAGPFFILPALGLWAAWYFRKQGWISWKVMVISILAASVGFAGNFIIFKAVANEQSAPFSNFSYTLYGTAVGGKGWRQIFVDHPEIAKLEDPELSNQIYSLAFDEIKRNPSGFIQGSLNAWKSLFSLDFYGMFGFVQGSGPVSATTIRLLLFLSSLAGLIGSVVRWKSGFASFVLASLLGILLSVPFVPPLDAEIRTYAAVIPVFIILACMGLAEWIWLADKVRKWRGLISTYSPEAAQTPNFLNRFSAAFALIFGLAAILGPLIVWVFARAPHINEITCPQGEEAVYLRVNPGSYIQVVEDQTVRQTWLPVIRWNDFSRSIHDFPFYEITEELDPVTPPTTLTFTYDLISGRHVWLVADTRIFPNPTGIFAVCGTWSKNIDITGYGFFYGNMIQLAGVDGLHE